MCAWGLGLVVLAALRVPLITNGNDDAGDPAVAALVDPSGTTVCSGTVIDAYFVLTAAHCVPAIPAGSSVVLGSTVGSPTTSVSIAEVRADPAFDASTLDHDAALIVVAEALPVAPAPLGTSAPGVGSLVTVVGWGKTSQDAGDYGTKRIGASKVTAVDTLTFQVAPDPSQPCSGDSGGPAFATTGGVESVVGVTSHGDAACSAGATFTRVDAETAGFIAPTMAALGPGTVGAGERCLYAAQCIGGASACVTAPDAPTLTYCTEGCSEDADCPQRMICVPVTNGSQCRYPVPTPGALGGVCVADSDCIVGICYGGTCSVSCEPGSDVACPQGAACEAQDGSVDFFCVVPPPSITGGACAIGSSADGSTAACIAGVALLVARARRPRRRRPASPAPPPRAAPCSPPPPPS
jgi:hypothetical protein